MISILFIGVVTALAVFAILAKTYPREPKKAGKWERGEIIKQLLALSETENSISAIASRPATSLCPREYNSKRRYSPLSPRFPISLRPNQPDGEIEEKIRRRAYELYQRRGGMDGNPTDDWLKAKQEVLSHKARAGKTSS